MGRRGPTPKPDEIKELQGNPGKRKLNDKRPRPPNVTPKCPDWLDEDAQQEWKRVIKELKKIPGLVTKLDGTALAGYCASYSRWTKAELIIQKKGMTYVGSTGNIRTRPEVKIAQDELKLIRQFCAEFGLTPSSRSRMVLPKTETEDEFEKYLNDKGNGDGK